MVKPFKIQNIEVNGGTPFFILGPCGLENEEFAWDMARSLKEICGRLELPFVFKASYDKANRTSVDSFRGPGAETGCRVLGAIGRHGRPVEGTRRRDAQLELRQQQRRRGGARAPSRP